jgi:hypothetical protein
LENVFSHDVVMWEEAKTLFEKKTTETFWHFFFEGEPIDAVHEQLRKELSEMRGGTEEYIVSWNYKEFSKWVDEYLMIGTTLENTRRLRTMYFTRFHHSRLSHGNHHPAKLHILLQIKPVGISKLLSTIQAICPVGTTKWVTHERTQPFSKDLLIADQGKIVFSKIRACRKDVADDDSRNHFKMRSETCVTTTSFFYDEESQERKVFIQKMKLRQLHMAVTTDPIEKFDQNALSRFKVSALPTVNPQIIQEGFRPPDKHRIREQELEKMIRDHSKVHTLYYMVDMALQSGVTGECCYGLDMSLVRKSAQELGISDVRKVERLCEMVRCIAISFAVWMMLCSSNGEEIDLYLIRILLTHLKITEEMIVDAFELLAF